LTNLSLNNSFKENISLGSQNSDSVNLSNSINPDPLDFWESEMGYVNGTDLNIELGENFTKNLRGISYTAKEIQFESPNWVDAFPNTTRLRGYIIYPNAMKSKNPAVLYLHGLGGSANESFHIAPYYLQKGFIVLCYSYPGHGESEGPQPNPQSFFLQGQFNKTGHFYLTICSAIQALRVLESFPIVDNSSIMVTGLSYGGFNTMWLSSIAGERIAGAIPMIAWGDLKAQTVDPTSLIFWVWGTKAEDISDTYWSYYNHYFDPIYYLRSPKLPPILWQVGTNDDFFHYSGINGTFESANTTNKWLQIHPNSHHGLFDYEETTEYFIDYSISGGSSPPNISLKENQKEFGLLGDTLKIEVSFQSAVSVVKAQVCFRYKDIVGAVWETMDLTKYDDGYWRGILNPGIISSDVDYYIIVKLEGSKNIWFSSIIYTGGIFVSNFTIPFYIILVAAIGIPLALLIRRRYQKEVKEIDARDQIKAKKYLILELALIGVSETVFYLSLILPWAIWEGGTVVWTHIYVFDNLYPFATGLFLGVYISYLTSIFLIGWIVYSFISFMKPMLSGFIKIGYPLFVLLVIGVLTGLIVPGNAWSNFGIGYAGIGPAIMLLSSLAVFFIGIWKRKYQTKLGIRTTKRKHWFNVDRILRIKDPITQDTQKVKEIEKIEK
jgi:dienelactone hydrolase